MVVTDIPAPAIAADIPADELARLTRVAINVARKMTGAPDDDTISDALYGMAKALQSYDPNAGASLTTYVITRVRGEVLDGWRNRDHLSRSIRTKAKDGLVDLDAPVHQPPIHLQAIQIDNPGFDIPDPGFDVEKILDERAVARRVAALWKLVDMTLTPREIEVIRAYYADDEKMHEIGARLGITESRVSQIVKRACEKLRLLVGTDL